ncbi:fumarylacetoacetate hydrolase family protein [Geomicrobium sp. JCM 19039]|uniref:fumarylacetoacetate hydrolase family protein n=1 Tax=Geomicrobium sp. JCM 19039 TaxID=1460636 RepID=UPI00045F35B8|nr:fumarylacetoacetate hydrolase family protein [Geomicrobium sp. JCM 19039]GAK12183.1 predicted 2-keto-4-pentenoate hydratase/2-oxohepta-3-ene-1,7-dioic acid hydratase [Geomicrobium sp. JCM 19039]
MKLVTFIYNNESRIGALTEDKRVVDLNYAYKALLESEGKVRSELIAEAYIPADMEGFIEGSDDSLSKAQESITYALSKDAAYKHPLIHAFDSVKIDAPVRKPGKIICVGHNYREHIKEMGRELPENPVVFAKFANTITGPQDDIPHYPISDQLDYEAEFAFVVGKKARNVSREDALEHVAGYTIANDVTYRDIQRRTLEWLQGKTVEGSLPLGPWLVTSDELDNPSGLDVRLTVNGEERQKTNTSNFVFDVQELIEFLSNLMTLEPGDVVLTGTPGGVGVARDPQTFLTDGDVVRIEIDKVGVLENKVAKTELANHDNKVHS